MRYFEFVHNLGIHSWDIPALIVAVILVVMINVIVRKFGKKNKSEVAIYDEKEKKEKKPCKKAGKRRRRKNKRTER